MIRRFFSMFTKAPAAHRTVVDSGAPQSDRFSDIYELLFCDSPELYAPTDASTSWQDALYKNSDSGVVRALAENHDNESRVRLLAFRWLSARGEVPPSKEILGVVIEVGLEQGNDTLAAYSDGSVRYINQSGKLAVFEGAPPEVVAQAKVLVATSQPTVAQIGAWDKPRRPPPSRGDVRLTFLVADGLYFGEGPFRLLAKDPRARQVIDAGTTLLQMCVRAATAGV
jgi:hypothetical protein